MNSKPRWLTLPLRALVLLPGLAAADYIQAPFGPGGTWNVYETGFAADTFKNALANAQSRFDPVGGTVAGTLVSIINQNENDVFARTWFPGQDLWIGLTDREGAAPGAQESQTFGVGNTTNGWAWTSGEAFAFNAWGGGEPNDFSGAEDAAHIRGDGLWNDNASGFGLNEPIAPVLQPGTSNAEGAPTFSYVVEYFTGSATPLPGIRLASALPAPGDIPSIPGGMGTWGVREVRGITGVGNILQAVAALQSGGGTSTFAQMPRLDVADPDTNGTGGPILGSTPQPYLTNTAGVDDNDILTVANGKIQVTEAGTYTIQVRGDDGFALRVEGAEFTGVDGAGRIDPADPSSIYFREGTGDANTRGFVTLAVGTYNVQFVNWEGGGGAYYEVTSAKGQVTDPATAQWLALGDGTTLPARNSNPARLTGPVTVSNAAHAPTNLASATAAVDAAIGNNTAFVTTRNNTNIPEGEMPIAGTQQDNYATKVTGSFLLDDQDGTAGESITLTFGIIADDGASLRIVGQDFEAATDFTGDGDAALVDVSGDMTLVADYFTGNTNAFARITLVEGQTYDFEAYHMEGGGGSNLNIIYAMGDYLGQGQSIFFQSLTTDAGVTIAANVGLGLVPEPGSALLGLLSLGLLVRRRRA